MTSIAKSWQMIEEVLWENAHSVSLALRKPATPAQTRKLSQSFPRLPGSFQQSVLIHDGLNQSYLGHVRLFNYWALLPIAAILESCKIMTEIQQQFGFDGDGETDGKRLKAGEHWRNAWIPFMDADGDKLVIDLDPGPKGKSGQVFSWRNSGGVSRVIASSYGEWLSLLAGKLSKREFRLSERGDIWLDGSEWN